MSYSQIIESSLISAGSGVLYDLQLPIQTIQTNVSNTNLATTTTQPTLVKFELYNYTLQGSGTGVNSAVWLKGMPAGSALVNTITAGVPAQTLETTNGFTVINKTDLFGVEVLAITKANPGVATIIGPGFEPGQGIPNFATGDQFIFRGVAGSSGTDWAGLNGNTYTLTKITGNTFSFGVNTTSYTGTYTASSGIAYRTFTSTGLPLPPLNVADVGLRLGSAVVGATGNTLYYVAYFSDAAPAQIDIRA